MPRPRTTGHAYLQLPCLVLTVVIATSLASAFPRERRQSFTSCWGWGASCSMHSAVGRAPAPMVRISRPTPRRQPAPSYVTANRGHGGIPSIVTSGGWEPGTMGKRMNQHVQDRGDLLRVLKQIMEMDGYTH